MASRRVRAIVLALAVVALALTEVTLGGAQQIPVPPFYALLPANYPYALIRVCSTPEGICAVPHTVLPGQPCQCVRSDGVWVQGVCTH